MSEGSDPYPDHGVLDSWKEIAAYLDRDVSTVQRWEHQRHLPVRRIQGGKRGRVYALKSELDAWKYQTPPTDQDHAEAPAGQSGRRQAICRAAATVAIGVIVGILSWRFILRPPDAPLRFAPLANLPGEEVDPAFSPAGDLVAFAYRPEGTSTYDLYVRAVGRGEPLQLTNTPEGERYPRWSPDSRQIAFLRRSRSTISIWVMDATGGGERKIADIRWLSTDGEITLAWSKTGQDLIFPDRESDLASRSIYSLRLSTGVKTRLTHPPAGAVGDASPVLSPGGESLAFTRHGPSRVSDIWVVPSSGGDAKRITSDQRNISGLAWSQDGQHLVFLSDRSGPDPAIWRVAVTGGAPRLIAVLPSHSSMLALSGRAARIAYTRFFVRSSITRYELGRSSASAPSPERLIASGSIEAHPQYSPDGRAIAFMSDRSGFTEIWVCRADGKNPRQLTSLHGEGGAPSWSPDGKRIAFDMRVSGNHGIFLVGADGGPAIPVILDAFENGSPSWSVDGQWIYFMSRRSGMHEVWKVRPNGESLTEMTHNGGGISFESPDGRFLYYSKLSNQPGIFKKLLPEGDEVSILPSLTPAYLGFWQVGREGVFFLDVANRSTGKQPALKLLPYDGGEPRLVNDLDQAAYPAGYSGGLTTFHPMAISPDGKHLLITRLEHRQSNIMIAEGFR